MIAAAAGGWAETAGVRIGDQLTGVNEFLLFGLDAAGREAVLGEAARPMALTFRPAPPAPEEAPDDENKTLFGGCLAFMRAPVAVVADSTATVAYSSATVCSGVCSRSQWNTGGVSPQTGKEDGGGLAPEQDPPSKTDGGPAGGPGAPTSPVEDSGTPAPDVAGPGGPPGAGPGGPPDVAAPYTMVCFEQGPIGLAFDEDFRILAFGEGSWAAASGIAIGDQIVAVNNESISGITTVDDMADLIMGTARPMALKFKPGDAEDLVGWIENVGNFETDGVLTNGVDDPPPIQYTQSTPTAGAGGSTQLSAESSALPGIADYTVVCSESRLGLGFDESLKVVSMARWANWAAASGVVVGDTLVAVNSVSLEGIRVGDVLTMFQNAGRPLEMAFRPREGVGFWV